LAELFATGARLLLDALPAVWAGEVSAAPGGGATPQEDLGPVSHAAKVGAGDEE